MLGVSIDDLYRVAGPTGPGASAVEANQPASQPASRSLSPRQPAKETVFHRPTDRPVSAARIYYGRQRQGRRILDPLADSRTGRMCAQEPNTKSMRRWIGDYL